jgi:hypothetical protein
MPKAGMGGFVPMCKTHMPDHGRMDARVDGRALMSKCPSGLRFP